MKLSQFKKTDIKKKLTFFANGTSEVENAERHIVGEVNFTEITGELLDGLIETFANEENKENEIQLIYTLIPLISDIEVDVTLEEFLELYQNPTTEFMQLSAVILETINEIANKFTIYKRILEETNRTNEMMSEIEGIDNIPALEPSIEEMADDILTIDRSMPSPIIVDNLIPSDRVTANEITSDIIADGMITSDKIEDYGMTEDELAKSSVSDNLVEAEVINMYEGLTVLELQALLRDSNDRRVRLEIIKQINKIVYNQ